MQMLYKINKTSHLKDFKIFFNNINEIKSAAVCTQYAVYSVSTEVLTASA